MAPLSLYELSIPLFTKQLNVLSAILTKAEEHAKSVGDDADSYPALRLAESMLPLSFQVQVVSNTIKKSVWRLTGAEVPSWEDDESTMAQLHARIQKTLDLLKTVDAKSIDGKEDDVVELSLGKAVGTISLPAKDYLLNYAITNTFFHLQTAYAILRVKGVPLGKNDYLESFMAANIAAK